MLNIDLKHGDRNHPARDPAAQPSAGPRSTKTSPLRPRVRGPVCFPAPDGKRFNRSRGWSAVPDGVVSIRADRVLLMWVGSIEFELLLGNVGSLKEKRSVVRPIVSEVRRRYQVSVAEVGHLDLHRRTAIGVAVVAAEPARITESWTRSNATSRTTRSRTAVDPSGDSKQRRRVSVARRTLNYRPDLTFDFGVFGYCDASASEYDGSHQSGYPFHPFPGRTATTEKAHQRPL